MRDVVYVHFPAPDSHIDSDEPFVLETYFPLEPFKIPSLGIEISSTDDIRTAFWALFTPSVANEWFRLMLREWVPFYLDIEGHLYYAAISPLFTPFGRGQLCHVVQNASETSFSLISLYDDGFPQWELGSGFTVIEYLKTEAGWRISNMQSFCFWCPSQNLYCWTKPETSGE